MIFVTIGTQLPFDRFIGAVDEWCGANPSVPVFAQVGSTKLTIRHMQYEPFITQEQANKLFMEASMIVTHAGIGSILTGLRYRKPIVVVPRRAMFGEHRNDHQFATAKWLTDRSGIRVVWNETDIAEALDNHMNIQSSEPISDYATPEFLERLEDFISG